jgi:hypothetical protein
LSANPQDDIEAETLKIATLITKRRTKMKTVKHRSAPAKALADRRFAFRIVPDKRRQEAVRVHKAQLKDYR